MKILQPQAALPALAAMLTLLLAVEWLLPGAAPQHIAPPIPAAAADVGTDAAVGQWADTILARPIFNPDRRPAAQADSSDAAEPLPRLTAIIIVAGVSRAVFSALGAKPILVGQGGAVGGYQLKEIKADSVSLLGPDGGITKLRPQFLAPAATSVPGNAANTNQ
jgi:general secretion pathway protein N